MNNPIRIAIAAAAVVVLALIGVNFIPKTGGVAGPSSTPVPTATAAARATAAATATAAPTPSPTPVPTMPTGDLAPGTYHFDFITFRLPAGWTGDENGVGKPDSGPPNGMFVNTWRNIATVYNDPCHWQTTAVSVGPTVDAVVAAFVAQKRGSKVTPVDVTIDGFRGKEIDLVVPLNVKFAASRCDDVMYKSWTEAGRRRTMEPGSRPARPARHPRCQRPGARDQEVLLAGQHGRRPGRAPGDLRLHQDHPLTRTNPARRAGEDRSPHAAFDPPAASRVISRMPRRPGASARPATAWSS